MGGGQRNERSQKNRSNSFNQNHHEAESSTLSHVIVLFGALPRARRGGLRGYYLSNLFPRTSVVQIR